MATIETYIELISCGVIQNPVDVSSSSDDIGAPYDVTYYSTYQPLNTSDYDGTVSYYFEVVAFYQSTLDTAYVDIVDEDNTICGTTTWLANTEGPIGPTSAGGYTHGEAFNGLDYVLQRVAFTPTSGDHSYAVRVRGTVRAQDADYMAAGEPYLNIFKATVVISQAHPTASVVHIPMLAESNAGTHNNTTPFVGGAHVTDGSEGPNIGMASYDTSYAANDTNEANNEYYTASRPIWRYSASELATVSEVVFDASVGYIPETPYTKTATIFGVPNLSWVRSNIRWSPNSKGDAETFTDGSGYTNATTTGSESGYTYTYVEPATGYDDFVWSQDSQGSNYYERVYLDTTSMEAADGSYLYWCSDIDSLGGSDPYGQYSMYARMGSAVLNLGGKSINRAYLDFHVYIPSGESDEKISCKLTIEYADSVNDGYIALFDITSDAIVPNSELHWDTRVRFERKTTTIDASNLTDGHEYQARWYQSEATSDYNYRPQINDINLWVKVTGMTAFTSWYRVAQNYIDGYLFGKVYADYGGTDANPDYYEGNPYYADDGTVNSNSRIRAYLPSEATVYFEMNAHVYSGLDQATEDGLGTSYGGTGANWLRVTLWDCGTTDNLIGEPGTVTGQEVSGSNINYTSAYGDGLTHRLRTSDISSVLTDGNRYCVCMPIADFGDPYYYPLQGFIVTTYDLSGIVTTYQPITEWLTESTGSGGAGAATNATLVYAYDLEQDQGGWYFDTYNPNVTVHYGEEGDERHALLAGGADGTVYQMAGNTDDSSVISCHVRTRNEDLDDSRPLKLWGDVWIDASTQEADITAQTGYDNWTSTGTATDFSTAGRSSYILDPSDWVEARNIGLDLAWASSTEGQKLFHWQPRFTGEKAPIRAFSWETSETTFRLQGFVYTGWLMLPHISTADLSLVFTVDGAAQPAIAITHNSGSITKDFIRLPVMKGKVWKLSIYAAERFRVSGNEVELLVKPWGQGGPWRKAQLFADMGPSEIAQ